MIIHFGNYHTSISIAMADVIKVSSNRIKNDSDEIKRLGESIPGLINELKEHMQRLANCWEGPAWAAFQRTVMEYMEILSEDYEAINRFVAGMYEASEDYKKAEREIYQSVK